jgi:hypothetical protein
MKAKEKVWIDSGYDCDHCGGELLRLKARRPSRPNDAYYRCQRCDCKWTLGGDVVQVGQGAYCHEAQGRRQGNVNPQESNWLEWLWTLPRWVQMVGGVLLLLLLLRFGGLMLFRLLLPVALLALMGYLILRYGQEREWW